MKLSVPADKSVSKPKGKVGRFDAPVCIKLTLTFFPQAGVCRQTWPRITTRPKGGRGAESLTSLKEASAEHALNRNSESAFGGVSPSIIDVITNLGGTLTQNSSISDRRDQKWRRLPGG